jgi:hypothetical protein
VGAICVVGSETLCTIATGYIIKQIGSASKIVEDRNDVRCSKSAPWYGGVCAKADIAPNAAPKSEIAAYIALFAKECGGVKERG